MSLESPPHARLAQLEHRVIDLERDLKSARESAQAEFEARMVCSQVISDLRARLERYELPARTMKGLVRALAEPRPAPSRER